MTWHRVVAALIVTMAVAGSAFAQVGSTLQSISLTANKGQSVSLGVPSPATQALTIVDDAINNYSAPFSITVTWDVANSTATTVKLVAYFTTPVQALANGTDYIPSSRLEASTDGGATWLPFTGAAVGGVGTAGGSRLLYTSAVTQGGNHRGAHAVSFLIRINLVGAPSTSAGTYSGTLNLMAICS